jgi:glycosyltransferase involved in cell wall biosynthesis
MSEPVLVSIITPILNGAKYLDLCLESVLSQDHAPIEHVFVDGGSTDGTLQRLATYQQQYPERVRVLLEPGTGPGEAWDRGLRVAKGEIFGCLGVDDVYATGAIRSAVEFFEANPDARFVHGQCEIVDDTGTVISRPRLMKFDFREFVNTAWHIATPSAFYKRELLERIEWLDENGDDFDLMIRIARDFEIYGMPKVLSRVRVWVGSAFNPSDFGKRLAVCRQTYRVSRKYGGRRWSPIARRYYVVWVLHRLHLKAIYPALRKLYRATSRMRKA